MKNKTRLITIHLLLFLCTTSLSAHAGFFDSFKGPLTGTHPLQNERFVFSAAVFYPSIDTDAAFGGDDGTAAEIDLEDSLGLDENGFLPLTRFTWRMTDRWQVLTEYFRLSDDADKILTVDVDTGDGTFITGGAGVVTSMDLDILRVAFTYSFLREDNYELGAGIGAHIGKIDGSITGLAFVDDGMGGGFFDSVTSDIDAWAPLPNLAFFTNYAITDQWLIEGRVDWFAASFGDYTGNLWNVTGALNWHPFEHVGFYFLYKFINFDIKREKDNRLDWQVDFEYRGPALGVNVTF